MECVGCEYLTQSKPSVVTLVNQISSGVHTQIHYIFVLCSLFSMILLFGRGFDRVLPFRVVAAIELEADK